MADRIALVLHEDADEKYAAALAAALTPVRAITTAFAKARDLKLGAGATCVIVWTPAVADDRAKDLEEFVGVVEPGACLPSGVIGVCLPGAAPPEIFARTGVRTLVGNGNPDEDAAAARESLTQLEALDADSPAHARSRSYRAAMGGAHRAGFSANSKPAARLMARSAVGMAATIAVVAFASQYIGSRARAAAAPSDDLAEAAAGSVEGSESGLSAERSQEGEAFETASNGSAQNVSTDELLLAFSHPAPSAPSRAAPRMVRGSSGVSNPSHPETGEAPLAPILPAVVSVPFEPLALEPLPLDTQPIGLAPGAADNVGAAATEQLDDQAHKKGEQGASQDAGSVVERPAATESIVGKAPGTEAT